MISKFEPGEAKKPKKTPCGKTLGSCEKQNFNCLTFIHFQRSTNFVTVNPPLSFDYTPRMDWFSNMYSLC